MFELLGICLALAIFLVTNMLAAIATSLCWRVCRVAISRWSAQMRAQILFVLRLTPPVLGAIAVVGFFLPAYVNYESRANAEAVSTKLAAFAIISIAGLAVALFRAGRALLATRELLRAWLNLSDEISIPGINVPAFRIGHAFPIIAVIGVLRPRLFIAEHVLRTLTPEELSAAVEHEYGHLRARDNLKRGLVRACRDLLLIPVGSSLERSWSEAVESAADEYAAQTNPDVALNLASALVKIARMVPVGARAEMPLAAFLVGDETRGIKARVRRLLEIASTSRNVGTGPFEVLTTLPMIFLAITLAASAVIVSQSQVLLTVHLFVERVVSLLS